MAISPKTGDLYLDKGNIARVSGVESLPQVIRQCLSLNRVESPFHPTFGARLSDYFENYRGSDGSPCEWTSISKAWPLAVQSFHFGRFQRGP